MSKSKVQTKTRNQSSLCGLFLGFIFVVLSTVTIIQGLRQHIREEPPKLTQETCLNNLTIQSLEPNQICQLLVGKTSLTDFKISETVTSEITNSSSEILTKIELPVTDFYNPFSNLQTDQLSDSNYLTANQISFVDPSELSVRYKLLSLDDRYYLDNPKTGARFSILHLETPNSSDLSTLKNLLNPLSKNDLLEKNITSFAETGVTALTRRLTFKLNQIGNATYFSEQLSHFLQNKTFTHLSNEVSFTDNCQGSFESMSLCADWRMLDTITDLGTDIIELTGNHNNDAGINHNLATIAKYRELGLKLVGGGENLEAAKAPLDINGSIRLLAYNHSTSSIANGQLATESSPGANPYSEEQVIKDITSAKEQHKFIIINIQFFECYAYPDQRVAYPRCDQPIENQKEFFRHLIDLGADMVVGTSAHQPQTFELYQEKPIFYGLGNLFFDQVYWPDTKRSLILTHYFDGSKYLQTRISPTIYDDSFKTRFLDQAEAQAFLSRLISASPKGN